ncbi:MAG: hypothetical protein DCC68_17210 [Planctomycetota bacterium]|nr:MAG: hypothetical protein DCC68_17210 [Planctomycetota bacterium]
MRIKKLSITAFGATRGLEFAELEPGLTVVYGTNEAGKTTLMNFLRSMLYGFDGARRQRYLPPAGGERGGGAIDVVTAEGAARIVRYAVGVDPDRDELNLTAGDGLPRRGAWLAAMLSDVDEAMFNNIFAVGLDEIQELSTLSDSDAAQLLYDLSTGRDRVSLGEVTRDLSAARERIIAADGRPARVSQLLGERARLREQASQLAAETNRLGDLSAARRRVREEIARLEGEVAQLDERARLIETAAGLSDRWRRRAALDAELAALGPVQSLPLGAVEELGDIKQRLETLARRRKKLRRRHRAAVARLKVQRFDDVVRRAAPRIEALAEQTPFITSLEAQIAQLDTEIATIEEQLSVERGAVRGTQDAVASAVRAPSPAPMTSFAPIAGIAPDSPKFSPLRRAAKRLRETQEQLEDAEADAERIRRADAALQRDRQAKDQRSPADLPAAIEKAGSIVAQLRRRMAIDDRLEQIKRSEMDVEDDNQHLMHEQVLPAWALVSVGAAFVLGMALLGWGAIKASSGAGWTGFWLALVGAVAGVASMLYKLRWEYNAQRQLDSGLRQLEALRRETKRLHDERDELDIELPSGGGPLAVRLQAAERELASLEQTLCADVRRTAGVHDIATAELRRDQCRVEHERAKQRWQEALLAAGLPADFLPARLRELGERGRNVGELERRLTATRAERDQRRREHAAISARVQQLATEIQLGPSAPTAPVQAIAELVARLRSQQAATAEYEALKQDSAALVRKLRRCRRKSERLSRRRREIVSASGAATEDELHRLVALAARAGQVRKQRDAADAEIAHAVAGHSAEKEILALLESDAFAAPDGATHEVVRRATERRDELRKLYEQRGRLDAEIHALAEDRRLAAVQFELTCIESQLAAAMDRFAVLAGVGRVLDLVRENYETRKQPQTLVEASAWLARLTDGRYSRVWTPLGEHVLMVEDAAGKSLGVEMLSRGAREQLFLALRMAIVDSYARRGARLPVILDDVLVNFDVHRARAAVAALADFARSGHQVFVFTCHEHIEALFRREGADARRLPGCGDSEPRAIETPSAKPAVVEAEPRRAKVRRPKPTERPRGIFHKLPVIDWPHSLPIVAPPEPSQVELPPLLDIPAATVEVVQTTPYVEPVVVTPPPFVPPPFVPPPVRAEAPPPLPPPPPEPQPVIRPLVRRPRPVSKPERQVRRRWRSKGWDPAIEVPIEEESFVEVWNEPAPLDGTDSAPDQVAVEEDRDFRAAPRPPVVRPLSAPRAALSEHAWPGGWASMAPVEMPASGGRAWRHVDAAEAEFADYEGSLADDLARVRHGRGNDSAA